MSATDRAKRLRGAVAAAVGPGKVDVVLRAVVEALGVTEEMVEQATPTPILCPDPSCDQCAPARALAALLEAAEER